MKKINLAILALAGLLTASCDQEHIDAQFFSENVTAQGLGTIKSCELSEDGSAITTTYSEVDFGLSVPTSYTLFMDISGNDFAKAKKLDATIADGIISIEQKKLNKSIINLGIAPDSLVSVDFRLDAFMQNEKLTNLEQYVQHSNVVTATFRTYEEIKGDLPVVDVPGDYQGWAPSDYPKLFNYSYDEVIYRGVVDFQGIKADGTAKNGFKITGGGNWDNESGNWGTPKDQAEPAEAASITLVNGADNILCYGEKRYYLFEFNKESLKLSKILSFDKVGVIGINGWEEDILMTYNMYYGRFWVDVDVAADAEFKFRLDGDWTNNWGGPLEALVGGGENIKIAAGQYRIYFYMNDVTAYCEIDPSMYGKEEPTIKKEEPVVTYKGWGIIGVNNDWEKDIAMTEKDGIWTGYTYLTADDSWKLRKDAAWDENYGGVFQTLGVPFEAVSGGDNISVRKTGFFKIVFNTNDNTITVSEAVVWGVMGDYNEWAADTYMTEENGKWFCREIKLKGGWKIRKNSAWDENFGGVFEALDKPFQAIPNGDNIDCGEGVFNIEYDPAAGTITVSSAVKTWGVIGDFNDWGGDVKMNEVMPGIWISEKAITNAEGKGWKVRFNYAWDQNFGGATPEAQGIFTEAVPGGDNITLAGTFKVVLNTNNNTIGALGWGVTGAIASCGINWDNDVPMYLTADGKWCSVPVYLETSDEFKIRLGDWADDRGGVCSELEKEFDVTKNGANMKVPANGTYMIVYDPSAEKITVTNIFWGIVGAFTSNECHHSHCSIIVIWWIVLQKHYMSTNFKI